MSEYPTYLVHHGIKDQKWGIRRFQNEDGSLTPEGRERYLKGQAKADYETKKYKANLKSKAQRDSDTRKAREVRNRIKENAKTARLIKRENTKTEQDGRSKSLKFKNTKKMSDEELQTAINRLKLQSEYNKQYVLAKHPDGALAKADRFFEGPTGEAVTKIAVAAVPNISKTVTEKLLEAKINMANNPVQSGKGNNQAQSNTNNNQVQSGNKPANNPVQPGKTNPEVKTQPKNEKATVDDMKSVVKDTRATVETGYKLYKAYNNTFGSKSVKSIPSSYTSGNVTKYYPENVSNDVIVTPVTQIAGYLPEKSSITTARSTSLDQAIKKK